MGVGVGVCGSGVGVRVGVGVGVGVGGCHVFAIYENNISPRLIMIIIKTIILYFIQMTHSDDFHSTGTRLVGLQIIGLRTCKLIETVNYEIYFFLSITTHRAHTTKH